MLDKNGAPPAITCTFGLDLFAGQRSRAPSAPINTEAHVSTFYTKGPLIREIVHYSPDPAIVNPITNKRDMRDFPPWAYVCIEARWIGVAVVPNNSVASNEVVYVDAEPPRAAVASNEVAVDAEPARAGP